MKKIFILTITLCMVFVLTACTTKKKEEGGSGLNNLPTDNTGKQNVPQTNTKHLECNKDYSSQMTNGVTMDQDVEMDFVDDKVELMVMSMNFEMPSNLASAADTYINTMKSTYDAKYGIYNGVTVKLERDSTTEFSIIITMDFPKISEADKASLGMSGSQSYSVNKTAFINQGYTCE